jgi:hypothetical protein
MEDFFRIGIRAEKIDIGISKGEGPVQLIIFCFAPGRDHHSFICYAGKSRRRNVERENSQLIATPCFLQKNLATRFMRFSHHLAHYLAFAGPICNVDICCIL